MKRCSIRSLLVFTLAAFATLAAAATPDYDKRGADAWADVKVLADDNMEGRRAGTPAHRRAAEYVAAEFRKAGLAPGGDGGYFQSVALESRTLDEPKSSVALVGNSGEQTMEPGVDYMFGLRGNFAPSIEAPLVFAGYGLQLPQYGHDDLGGLDLEGKVVVAFSAAPKSVPGAAGAHFGSAMERWRVYRAAGAVGMVLIPNPFSSDVTWEHAASTRFDPYLALGPPEADLYAGQKLWVAWNYGKLDKLFAGAQQSSEAVLAKLKDGEALPRFDLPLRIRATVKTTSERAVSENVIGVWRGSDPKLRSEYVVLSAHVDHLGITAKGDDHIFNGAMDNATGVALLLDVARHLGAAKAKPKRSIVFVAVTAEEAGLLGSRAFVSRAQRLKLNVVANVNTDMFLPIYPLKKVVVFGLEESDLADDIRAAAASLGLGVMTDPQPARNRFIRSDQYSFVRAGIPALALKVGVEPGTPEADIEKQWTAERYHAVSDDLDQPVNFATLGEFCEMAQRLALHIANRAKAPQWNATSPFNAPRGAAK